MYLSNLQKYICKTCNMCLSKSWNVADADGLPPPLSHNAHPLRAVISAPADGSLGYNDHIWWHLSCIFLHYAFVEWKSDTWPHKLSIIIANQICTNRRVSALCFVNLPNMQKGIQDSRIYFEVRCRQLFEATDARSAVGGVILSILRGGMPFECDHCCGSSTTHLNMKTAITRVMLAMVIIWWYYGHHIHDDELTPKQVLSRIHTLFVATISRHYKQWQIWGECLSDV